MADPAPEPAWKRPLSEKTISEARRGLAAAAALVTESPDRDTLVRRAIEEFLIQVDGGTTVAKLLRAIRPKPVTGGQAARVRQRRAKATGSL